MEIPRFVKKHKKWIITGAVVLILIGFINSGSDNGPAWTTTTVERGDVRSLVSISGAVDAVSTAELAFPVNGTLASILVKEGDIVKSGQLLGALGRDDLQAEYQDAYAALLIAEADRDELINGMRSEERAIGETTVLIAQEDLERTTREQNERVQNAYQQLLSEGLEARTTEARYGSDAPIVTGTYTCEAGGTYTLFMFRSNARSGFSYRLDGIETGTFTAHTDSPSFLGSCGLYIQFAENASYGNSEWIIEIPNTRSNAYITNKNAYDLAVTERANEIEAKTQALTLAKQNNSLDLADPRNEARTRAEARVLQAQARVQSIEAQLSDHALFAPFDGTITKVTPVVGETVGTLPVITMVSDDAYEITALVPEIDITKVHVGQKAEVVFDARQEETLTATVTFISPLAQEIDGVSYFEANLMLDTGVDWLRSGLNADIDILIEERTEVTRIPKRYLIEKDGKTTVLVPNGEEKESKEVQVGFTGNDGFVEISGIEEGATIVAP